jgi:hypothetical protein
MHIINYHIQILNQIIISRVFLMIILIYVNLDFECLIELLMNVHKIILLIENDGFDGGFNYDELLNLFCLAFVLIFIFDLLEYSNVRYDGILELVKEDIKIF